MYRMLQAPEPETFVLATNRTETVRDFVRMAFKAVDVELDFRGSGVDEQAVDVKSGKTLVRVNPKFYRPAEVDLADWQSRQGQGQAGMGAAHDAGRTVPDDGRGRLATECPWRLVLTLRASW